MFKYAANLEIPKNCLIISIIRIHKRIIQINENKYHSKLKKKIDHKKLTASWYVYMAKALALSIGDALALTIK